MTDLTERLDAIQKRMDAATPGPWRWDEDYGSKGDEGLALTNDAGAEIVGAYNHHCCAFRDDPTVEDNDAEFIAAAPSDIPFLLDLARKQGAAIEAVTARLDEWDSYKAWPDAEETQVWYSAGKRHASEAVRALITEALEAKP